MSQDDVSKENFCREQKRVAERFAIIGVNARPYVSEAPFQESLREELLPSNCSITRIPGPCPVTNL